ncbi:aminotransferase class I/II-fold pyridoxal phosphate-dependent enzyme [Hyphomicrobium sp. LHD-15]|uniref:pyridoxal phosphate-dependent aminotransferase n=1 Tax=Hyphomicrobium sp. LHD-15 TaxID=3072142 RepID=UPI00280E12C3|nr:aminotransferase class I/II-fold pyridoxal phosphate-dependent enzyme [Hyphomicrobium sp. LHD-15]MDQ8699296.1 aminotransferase class I/II-fold pyridoxal phosphate-dependent enzyme [Hyphomicrobium sp. LHD-15]
MSDEQGLGRKRARAERGPARRSDIASFIVMDVMREAAALEAEGRSVIHMEVGQPGTPAPAAALAKAKSALGTETLGYTAALGIDGLRHRIARSYGERYNVDIDDSRVVVCTGSSAAFILAFLAVFDTGAQVALPSPGYPCYRHILSALGCRSPLIETGPETRWMPTLDALARLDRATGLDGLLIASPANPTGTIIEPHRLAELVGYCDEHGLWFISDEIYHGLTYEKPATTALSVSDDVIVINSFSKYYAMTGWRIGWLIVPPSLVRVVERLQQNLFISAPAVSQVAALGAFEAEDELEGNRETYANNRALLLEALPQAGFTRIAPADGAFYLYADVSAFTDDARAFASAMLNEIGVAVTPGLDFDEARGRHFLRFSYAGTEADIREGANRILSWSRLRTSG